MRIYTLTLDQQEGAHKIATTFAIDLVRYGYTHVRFLDGELMEL